MERLKEEFTIDAAVLLCIIVEMPFLLFDNLSRDSTPGLVIRVITLIIGFLAIINNWKKTDWSVRKDKINMIVLVIVLLASTVFTLINIF